MIISADRLIEPYLGVTLQTGNDANLTAGRDLNVFAATSHSSGSSSATSFSAGAGLGATAGVTSGASYGLTASAALGWNNAENTSTTRQNAEITAGGRLSTASGRDTTISGANLLGDHVDMRVGRDLRVESVRDKSSATSSGGNVSVNATIGMGTTAPSGPVNTAGGNVGLTAAESGSDLIGRQTSVIGVNGVNIYTEDNTHIKGAIIAALNDNLTLNTGTLSYEDMKGSRKDTSLSVGLTGSWNSRTNSPDKENSTPKNTSAGTSSGWLQNFTAKQKELNKQWNSFKKGAIVAPGALTYVNSETGQTARATVGAGTIIVRDNPNADISGLNRDISQALTEEVVRNTNTRLDPLFSYVDRAFSYTGFALDIFKTPEKPGGGGGNTSPSTTVHNPVERIQRELGLIHK